MFYLKIQNKFPVYKTDYKALGNVKKVDNREKYLGKKIINDLLNNDESEWINIFDLIYHFPKIEAINLLPSSKNYDRAKSRNTYPLDKYIEAYNTTPLNRIIYTFFNSIYARSIYLDDFIMLILEYRDVSIKDVCNLISDYADVGKVLSNGKKRFFIHKYLTLNNPIFLDELENNKEYRFIYQDYDYINREFYVKIQQENI